MNHAVYSHPCNVAAADQLAASLEPSMDVRLSRLVDDDVLYVVDEDAVRDGRNLYAASVAIYKLHLETD